MNKKIRTAAVVAAAAVAGTTLALAGGLPAAADNNDTPSTEWCNEVSNHTRGHGAYTEHMDDTMGQGMGWGFDEMGPDADMDDTMGSGSSRSMERGGTMGR